MGVRMGLNMTSKKKWKSVLITVYKRAALAPYNEQVFSIIEELLLNKLAKAYPLATQWIRGIMLDRETNAIWMGTVSYKSKDWERVRQAITSKKRTIQFSVTTTDRDSRYTTCNLWGVTIRSTAVEQTLEQHTEIPNKVVIELCPELFEWYGQERTLQLFRALVEACDAQNGYMDFVNYGTNSSGNTPVWEFAKRMKYDIPEVDHARPSKTLLRQWEEERKLNPEISFKEQDRNWRALLKKSVCRVDCDAYICGYSWGFLLNERIIKKLGGKEAILQSAPAAHIWDWSNEAAERLFVQMTESVLDMPEKMRFTIRNYFSKVLPELDLVEIAIHKGMGRKFDDGLVLDSEEKRIVLHLSRLPKEPFRRMATASEEDRDAIIAESLTVPVEDMKIETPKSDFDELVAWETLPDAKRQTERFWILAKRKSTSSVFCQMSDSMRRRIEETDAPYGGSHWQYIRHKKNELRNIEANRLFEAWSKEYDDLLRGQTKGESEEQIFFIDPQTQLLTVPCREPWELALWIPMGGFNDCPPPEEQASVFRHWQERYGAIPYYVNEDTWVLKTNRPLTESEARVVAREQFLFCIDLFQAFPAGVNQLATHLQTKDIWVFWWD